MNASLQDNGGKVLTADILRTELLGKGLKVYLKQTTLFLQLT